MYGMNVNHLVEQYHQLIEEDLRRIEQAMGLEFEEAVEEAITGKSSPRKARAGVEPERKGRGGDAESEAGGKGRRRRDGAGSTFMDNDRERGRERVRGKPLDYVRGGGYDEENDVAEGGGGPLYDEEEEEGGVVTKRRPRKEAREEDEDERWREGDATGPSTPARLKVSHLDEEEDIWGEQEVRKGRYAGEQGLPPNGGPRESSAKVKGPIGPEARKKVGRREEQLPVEAVVKGEGKALLTLRDLLGEDEQDDGRKTKGGRRKGKADKAGRKKKKAASTRSLASEEESEEEDEAPKGRKTIRRTRRRGMGSRAMVVSAPSAWTSMAAGASIE